MEMNNTLFALKQSSKGKLKYQKDWGRTDDIKLLLEDCTSPPQLTTSISDHVANMSKRNVDLSNKNEKNGETKKLTNSSNIVPVCSTPKQLNRHGPNSRSSDNRVAVRKISDSSNQETTSMTPPHTVLSPQASHIEVAIKHVEDELKSKAEHNLKLRRERMEQQSRLLLQRSRTQLWEFEQNQELEAMKAHESLEANHLALAQQIQRKKDKMKESHQRHAEMVTEKIVKAEAQKKRLEELEKRRRAEANKLREQIQTKIAAMKELKANTDNQIASFADKKHLSANFTKYHDNVALCVTKVEGLLTQANEDKHLEAVMKMVMEISSKQQNIVDVIMQDIAQAKAKGDEERAQQRAAEQEAKKVAEATVAKETAAKEASNKTAVATASSLVQEAEGEILCVLPGSLTEYEKLLKKQKQIEDAVKVLSSTPQLKKFKMDLQKAINTPVNALANTSGAHLRDKLKKLSSLLSGQPVEVAGKRVSAGDHPAAIPFCFDLLAKKLVKQGEEQISSNHEYAFVYAAIAVGIWCEFPVFGDLLRAHFFLKCPYLVPYYKPKTEGQSSEDYFKSLGYQYKDGECEKQDKFLKRMSGIARLYAAIMISAPPPGTQANHPFNLDHAWSWYSSILNIQPRPDITASVLFDFLEITGNKMWTTYGKQFQKMLHIICIELMGKIWQVTPQGAGGPVKRLELFLQKCLTSGTIQSAKGTFPPNFWFS